MLYIFIIAFSPVLLYSQSKADNLALYQLTEQNGLSDNQVTCFFQDSHGFMWIGTKDGLNRYDGSVIKTFKKISDANNELAGNTISAITEDTYHHLWIGTKSGISEYDPAKNMFRSYLKNIVVTDLCFDENGNLWIASWEQLIRFTPGQEKIIKYINRTSTDALTERNNNHFNKIIIDDKKRLWLATFNGLWQFFQEDAHFEYAILIDNGSGGLITKIIKDHEGKLWLGYWDSGLKRFDPDKRMSENFSDRDIPRNITGIAEVKNLQGNYSIWCNDLVEFDPLTKTLKKHLPSSTESLENYQNSNLYISKDSLLWISTDKGVRIMDPSKQFFHHHFLSAQKITSQGIALLQHNSLLYVGGAGENFLKLYDSTLRPIKKVVSQPRLIENGQFVQPAVLNIVRENDRYIWLCTENGLFLFDEKANSYRLFRLKEQDISSSTRNFINTIFIDSKGNHWIFPWRSGIWQLDVKTGQFRKMILGLTNENNNVKKFLVAAAVEDPSGNLWFADIDEGLLYYDHHSGQFSKPTSQSLGDQYSLQNVLIEGKYVWCVKTGMVFRINTITKQMEQWLIPNEFNKSVTGFCSDKYDHLWITTASGLLSFNKTNHNFKRYTSNDGLIDNVMEGVIFPLDNGKILYAYNNYITEFSPNELMRSNKVPPAIITNIFSQNKPVAIKNEGKQEKYIELGYMYNNFTFNWTILNYSNPLQNRFYCKMEGVDKDWKFVGYTGQAQYASLQPGKYIFKVKGATGEGVMNEEGDQVRIIIHPPFWNEWWFITLSSVIALTLFVVIIRYISQRNLKEKLLRLEKEQAVEKERNRISRDMHDDLGSGLTKIAIMSEVVKKQIHEPEKAKQQLDNISASSRELIDNLQDIIWILNPKNDTLESLAAYIREYALKFFEPFGIDVQFNYPDKFPEIKLSEETRRNIFLVTKESFNNIAKHAWCNKVMISIEYFPGEIKFIIKDDGKGFDNSKLRPFGNGLINMKNRIEQIGGKYEITSGPGKGTGIKIEIPV